MSERQRHLLGWLNRLVWITLGEGIRLDRINRDPNRIMTVRVVVGQF
jgi:hypothetical protein